MANNLTYADRRYQYLYEEIQRLQNLRANCLARVRHANHTVTANTLYGDGCNLDWSDYDDALEEADALSDEIIEVIKQISEE